MSMKSFDKFCEKMILAEPGSEKEIYDERQSVMRLRLTREALLICVGMIIVNDAVTDLIPFQWAEIGVTVDLLFVALCMLWWEIRCAAKGCLVAVSGRSAQKTSAAVVMIVGAMNGMRSAFEIGSEDFLIKDGRLSGDFMYLLCSVLMLIYGIFILTAVRREERREETEKGEE